MTTKEKYQHELTIETLINVATKTAKESAEHEYNGDEKSSNFSFGAACAYAFALMLITENDLDVAKIRRTRLAELREDK